MTEKNGRDRSINKQVSLAPGQVKLINMVAIRCYACKEARQVLGIRVGCSYRLAAQNQGYLQDAAGHWYCPACKSKIDRSEFPTPVKRNRKKQNEAKKLS